MSGSGRALSNEEHSDESEAKRRPDVKRRPSRAGTRSVNTLSAAQLERKRANDREAQRAIRQRTKEHIEQLEKKVAELSINEDIKGQLTSALRRNAELEQENAVLRAKLEQASMALAVADSRSVKVDTSVFSDESSTSTVTSSMPRQRQDMTGSASPKDMTFIRQRAASLREAGSWPQQDAYSLTAMRPLPTSPTVERGFNNMSLAWPTDSRPAPMNGIHGARPPLSEGATPMQMDYGYLFSPPVRTGSYRLDGHPIPTPHAQAVQLRRAASQPQVPQLTVNSNRFFLPSAFPTSTEQMSPGIAAIHHQSLSATGQQIATSQMQARESIYATPHSHLDGQQFFFNLPPNG